MTFLPECGAVFQISLCIVWIHNDSMYVRFGGIRNTKTWSKSTVYSCPSLPGARITIFFIYKLDLVQGPS